MNFVRSVSGFKSYPGFLKIKGGKIFLYSFLMAALTFAVTILIPIAPALPGVFAIDRAFIDSNVPYFKLEDGKFSIDEPVVMDYANATPSSLIYITSNEVVPAEKAREVLRGYYVGFIIDSERMVIKSSGYDVREFPFSDAGLTFTRESLYDLIPWVKIFAVAALFAVFLVTLGGYMFGTLVCAVIGLGVNGAVKAPVSFSSIFKLATYARTAPVIIKLLAAIPPFYIRLNYFLFYAVFVVYIVFALKAVKAEEESGSGPFPEES